MNKNFNKFIFSLIVVVSIFFGTPVKAENWIKCKNQTLGCLNESWAKKVTNPSYTPDAGDKALYDSYCQGSATAKKDSCCLWNLSLSSGWCKNEATPYACYKTLSNTYDKCILESQKSYYFQCGSEVFATEPDCQSGKTLTFDQQEHYLGNAKGGYKACFLGKNSGDPSFPNLAACKIEEVKANESVKFNLYSSGIGSTIIYYCAVEYKDSGDTVVKPGLTKAECEAEEIKLEPKPVPVVTDKQYCCNCTSIGGNKKNITVSGDKSPDCGKCSVEAGVCKGIKDMSEIQKASKNILNPAGFAFGKTGVLEILGKMITFLLFPIGMIAMALYIWSGFLWMTAQGNSDNVGKAKQILVWTTLGIVVTLASYILVQFVFTEIL